MHRVLDSPVFSRLEFLDDGCPGPVVIRGQGPEMIDHRPRVNVDHIGGLTDRDSGEDEMYFSPAWPVLKL